MIVGRIKTWCGKYTTNLPDNLRDKFFDEWDNHILKLSNAYIKAVNEKYFPHLIKKSTKKWFRFF